MGIIKEAFKWADIILGGLVGLLLVAVVVVYALGSAWLNRSYEIEIVTVSIPVGLAAVARGRNLSEALAFCTGCHARSWVAKSSP